MAGRRVLLLIVLVGLGAGWPTSAAHAGPIDVSVTIKPEQTNFVRRYMIDHGVDAAHPPAGWHAWVEQHLAARVVKALATSVPMFTFGTGNASAALKLELVIYANGRWWSQDLMFVMKIPGSRHDLPARLLAPCPQPPCTYDLSADGWVTDAIKQAVDDWKAVGPALSTFPLPFALRGSSPPGLAEVDVQGKRIGVDEWHPATVEAQDSATPGIGAAWFVLCGTGPGGGAAGPYIDRNQTNERVGACGPAATSTSLPAKALLFLKRYWP